MDLSLHCSQIDVISVKPACCVVIYSFIVTFARVRVDLFYFVKSRGALPSQNFNVFVRLKANVTAANIRIVADHNSIDYNTIRFMRIE